MSQVASRELRNDTAGVLQRVQRGEDVIITVSGRDVARLVPLVPQSRRWLERAELVTRLHLAQADPAMRTDLLELDDSTTDDLGPIE